ncbi:hypothetical protein HDU92_005066 [Lobulomyces angularis]|nr:hypothetical protein HDU92_005066 [Lobulomyces angularis]
MVDSYINIAGIVVAVPSLFYTGYEAIYSSPSQRKNHWLMFTAVLCWIVQQIFYVLYYTDYGYYLQTIEDPAFLRDLWTFYFFSVDLDLVCVWIELEVCSMDEMGEADVFSGVVMTFYTACVDIFLASYLMWKVLNINKIQKKIAKSELHILKHKLYFFWIGWLFILVMEIGTGLSVFYKNALSYDEDSQIYIWYILSDTQYALVALQFAFSIGFLNAVRDVLKSVMGLKYEKNTNKADFNKVMENSSMNSEVDDFSAVTNLPKQSVVVRSYYLGTLAGVRGFQDPNVQMKKNKNSIFLQADKNSPDKVNNETILMPWLLSTYEGQCLTGGSNQRYETVMAWNSSNENTVEILGVNSMSYFDRSGIPFYYSLADNYLIGDNYKESVMANTCPNRVVYMAGTTMPERDYNGKNIPVESNSVQNKPYMDWETFPEHLEKHNITWRIWQNSLDLYDSNALSWFEQYQPKNNNTALIEKALTFFSLAEFQKACANGTLPQISWVISEQQLSEHPPWLPNSGEYFISQVSKAIITGKHANSTAAIINYDESGGFFDHVDPEVPAFGTPDTWVLKDRLFKNQPAPVGPGPRVPFFIISPYTKGKVVFSENSDHTSTLLFLEQWVRAKFQINITFPLISKWHREHMSDLVNAFDFTETNLTMNLLPTVKKPQQNVFTKVFVSSELCLTSQHFNGIPTPPYKNQTFPSVEAGFRTVRGYPLQGRFFTLESGKFSLTTYKYEVQLRPTIIKRNDPQQLFIFLETYGEKNRFKIKSLKVKNETGKSYCLNFDLNLVKCAIAPIWYVIVNSLYHNVFKIFSNE